PCRDPSHARESLSLDGFSLVSAALQRDDHHCFVRVTSSRSNPSLIALLKQEGVVKSHSVENAMRRTDRAFYARHPSDAYIASPQEIGYDQTLSAPHMHAIVLELLKDHACKPAARVLDVGSGSGFLCACFSRMVKIHYVSFQLIFYWNNLLRLFSCARYF